VTAAGGTTSWRSPSDRTYRSSSARALPSHSRHGLPYRSRAFAGVCRSHAGKFRYRRVLVQPHRGTQHTRVLMRPALVAQCARRSASPSAASSAPVRRPPDAVLNRGRGAPAPRPPRAPGHSRLLLAGPALPPAADASRRSRSGSSCRPDVMARVAVGIRRTKPDGRAGKARAATRTVAVGAHCRWVISVVVASRMPTSAR
jgi:hypothetical protein